MDWIYLPLVKMAMNLTLMCVSLIKREPMLKHLDLTLCAR